MDLPEWSRANSGLLHQVVTPAMHVDALQAYDSALRVKQTADIIAALHDVAFIDKKLVP